MFNQPGGPHFLTRLGTCKKREGDKGGREREEGKERERASKEERKSARGDASSKLLIEDVPLKRLLGRMCC